MPNPGFLRSEDIGVTYSLTDIMTEMLGIVLLSVLSVWQYLPKIIIYKNILLTIVGFEARTMSSSENLKHKRHLQQVPFVTISQQQRLFTCYFVITLTFLFLTDPSNTTGITKNVIIIDTITPPMAV